MYHLYVYVYSQILVILQNFTYLCMYNPPPITQHGLKMFLVLLFSCVVEIENVIENPNTPRDL